MKKLTGDEKEEKWGGGERREVGHPLGDRKCLGAQTTLLEENLAFSEGRAA